MAQGDRIGYAKPDPSDPTKYDFSLCHMGMLQRCPSRKDSARCEGCGVKPVCIHWESAGRDRDSDIRGKTAE